MRRGTTLTHTFTLPFSTDTLQEVRVIYRQGETCLVKTAKECELEGNTVAVTLTQEETLGFACIAPVNIQVRALTLGGEALASEIMQTYMGGCLENEVIS